jgi:hypothetical protein
MVLYAVSNIVTDMPDAVERHVHQIYEYASKFGAFVAHNPNEFAIACSAIATAVFTYVLATRTTGLFRETARLREETAVLAKFAKQQAEDMKASVAAARDSANAAMSIASSDRAWMSPAGQQVMHSDNLTIDDVEVGDGVMISVVWQNTGQTPALQASVYSTHAIIRSEEPTPFFVSEPSSEPKSTMIGPNVRVTTVGQPISGSNLERMVRRGELKCFIYSIVTYATISEPEKRRQSECCFLVEYNGVRIGEDGKLIRNIGLMPHGTQNTAS